jgi:hypothetical protein
MHAHQQFILDSCEEAMADSMLTRDGEVKCFMRDFKDWLTSNRSELIRWYADPSATAIDRPVAFPVVEEDDFLFFLSHWYRRITILTLTLSVSPNAAFYVTRTHGSCPNSGTLWAATLWMAL